jgi:hypothetical protein
MVGNFGKTAHFGNRFHITTLEPGCHTVSIATDSAKYISERIPSRDPGCTLAL